MEKDRRERDREDAARFAVVDAIQALQTARRHGNAVSIARARRDLYQALQRFTVLLRMPPRSEKLERYARNGTDQVGR